MELKCGRRSFAARSFLAFPSGADSPYQGEMSRSDRGDRERWHGEAVTDEGTGFGLGSLSAEEISPPAGGELLCPWRQSNQNATGDAADGHFVPIGPLSPDPITGDVLL